MDPIEQKEQLLEGLFHILSKAQLHLSEKKGECYTAHLECLGHVIDKDGMDVDPDKMAVICDWPTLYTVLDIQWFLGLVQY